MISKYLLEDNYRSIVKRGLIVKETTFLELLDKLHEEVGELGESYFNEDDKVFDPEELADVILVCFNIAEHFQIDINRELAKKIQKNFRRAKNGE